MSDRLRSLLCFLLRRLACLRFFAPTRINHALHEEAKVSCQAADLAPSDPNFLL
jgi:hypothetical protein